MTGWARGRRAWGHRRRAGAAGGRGGLARPELNWGLAASQVQKSSLVWEMLRRGGGVTSRISRYESIHSSIRRLLSSSSSALSAPVPAVWGEPMLGDNDRWFRVGDIGQPGVLGVLHGVLAGREVPGDTACTALRGAAEGGVTPKCLSLGVIWPSARLPPVLELCGVFTPGILAGREGGSGISSSAGGLALKRRLLSLLAAELCPSSVWPLWPLPLVSDPRLHAFTKRVRCQRSGRRMGPGGGARGERGRVRCREGRG